MTVTVGFLVVFIIVELELCFIEIQTIHSQCSRAGGGFTELHQEV